MKTVIVRPERCVGCMQCRFACAVAHSSAKTNFAVFERPLSKPRIHVGQSGAKEPFPNKCRHCDPAPCEMACITKAIYRETVSGTVLITPDRCINCGMCAMACPFGVVRYHQHQTGRTAAHKCDQCLLRQSEGKKPACVETCKTGALIFDELNKYLAKDTEHIAALVYIGMKDREPEKGAYPVYKGYLSKLEEIKGR